MYWETLRDEAWPDAPLEDRLAMYLAGDDAEAKATVASLIEDIGFAPVDVGTLAESGLIEPGSEIYNDPLPYPEATAAVERLKREDTG